MYSFVIPLGNRYIPTRVGKTIILVTHNTALAGYIPTRVGKTIILVTHNTALAGYIPTRVGKTLNECLTFGFQSGTSPHAWGKLLSSGRFCRNQRYIPTRVGKTRFIVVSDVLGVRYIPTRVGKTPINQPFTLSIFGTSPHAWGKRHPAAEIRCLQRYIPTRVGKTGGSPWPSLFHPVHPHTRGENY